MTSTAKRTRVEPRDVKKALPGLYPAVRALSASAEESGIEKELVELVNLRTSQINGCAYCLQLHTRTGRDLGIPEEKLTLTVAWEEGGIFSEREEAAFAWTEAVTLIAVDHIPREKYDAARKIFSEKELIGLTTVIATMNVWNRIAVAFRYPPEI